MFTKPRDIEESIVHSSNSTEVETIVGPSVKVDGDFVSEGNVLVQGAVNGNVKTAGHLEVKEGARILANVKAKSARVSGEIRGDMKIKEALELTPTAVIIGDVEAKTLVVASGALLHGRCSMPAAEALEPVKAALIKTIVKKKIDKKIIEAEVGGALDAVFAEGAA